MTNMEFYQNRLELKRARGDFDFCSDFIQPYMLHQNCAAIENFSCNLCHLKLMNWLQEEYEEPDIQPNYLINGLFSIPIGTPIKVWNEDPEAEIQASFVRYDRFGAGIYAIADETPEKWRYGSLLHPSEINWKSDNILPGCPILVRNCTDHAWMVRSLYEYHEGKAEPFETYCYGTYLNENLTQRWKYAALYVPDWLKRNNIDVRF